MKLQEENKDLIKEIEMYQIEIGRLKSLLIDGDPIGCHVDGRSVIGDKRPLSFEIVCGSDSIHRYVQKF